MLPNASCAIFLRKQMNPVTERTAKSALPLERDDRNRLIFPFLSALYTSLEPWAYAVMRAASGAMMATFGWQKLFADKMSDDIAIFHQLGLEPAIPLAYLTSGLEFFGGVAVAAGFLTRPFAAMLFGGLLVILVTVLIPRGISYQLSVVWWGAFLFIAIRGGGRISLDRLLGKEF
jgi:putative oxidoreductase